MQAETLQIVLWRDEMPFLSIHTSQGASHLFAKKFITWKSDCEEDPIQSTVSVWFPVHKFGLWKLAWSSLLTGNDLSMLLWWYKRHGSFFSSFHQAKSLVSLFHASLLHIFQNLAKRSQFKQARLAYSMAICHFSWMRTGSRHGSLQRSSVVRFNTTQHFVVAWCHPRLILICFPSWFFLWVQFFELHMSFALSRQGVIDFVRIVRVSKQFNLNHTDTVSLDPLCLFSVLESLIQAEPGPGWSREPLLFVDQAGLDNGDVNGHPEETQFLKELTGTKHFLADHPLENQKKLQVRISCSSRSNWTFLYSGSGWVNCYMDKDRCLVQTTVHKIETWKSND